MVPMIPKGMEYNLHYGDETIHAQIRNMVATEEPPFNYWGGVGVLTRFTPAKPMAHYIPADVFKYE